MAVAGMCGAVLAEWMRWMSRAMTGGAYRRIMACLRVGLKDGEGTGLLP